MENLNLQPSPRLRPAGNLPTSPRLRRASNLQPSSRLRPAGNLNLNPQQEEYYLFTMHRPENTEDPQRIGAIFKGLQACDAPIVYPVHPRMRKILKSPEIAKILRGLPQLRMCDPLGYLDILQLQAGARKIITDSGGMQKEAFFLRRPCITIRDESEWVETVDLGWNILVGADTARLRSAIRDFNPVHPAGNVYGDGNTAEIIAGKIRMFLEDKKLRR
ncbi:MAG: UDP-N-acetylglucosamine 2-epimerase [Candidatus Neomarinimicrobiota bacterium]